MENKIKKYEEKNKRILARSDIDQDILKEGLYELGITHDKYNHAFLSINISGKDLVSIGVNLYFILIIIILRGSVNLFIFKMLMFRIIILLLWNNFQD
jgi:hypothetical protein